MSRVERRLKQFAFTHYWWIIPTCVLVSLEGLNGEGSIQVVLGGVGAFYFVQSQRVTELTLFHKLFAEFNQRYDSLNGPLQNLLAGRPELTPTDRELLYDYFNLCAEEYFFYTQGSIPQPVWRAWCRGMLEYLDDPRIARLWHEEELSGSYYELTIGAIHAGAETTQMISRQEERIAA